jgi:Ca2+-binding RTX toxin-like protein
MAATPIEDVVHYLRTSGGSQGVHISYSDQSRIVFSIGGNLNAKEANFAKAAMVTWADLIDIPVEFGNSNVNIRLSFATDLQDGELGVNRPSAFFPTDHFTGVLINRNEFPDASGLALGSQEYFTFIHELGHSLGLTHPGPYNGLGRLVYGVNNVYPEDTTQYTVMSYFGPSSDNAPDNFNVNFATTPMLHDIAAIQSIYGANMHTRTGDNTYGFNSNTAITLANGFTFDPFKFVEGESPTFTIWDAGGIDTIDASGFGGFVSRNEYTQGDYVIDLRAGHYSSIGFVPGFVQPNGVLTGTPLVNNIAIAFGVTIENAIGGAGGDKIIGNDVANVLSGNGGSDIIFGGGGDDTIDGGTGNDTLFGESDDDTLLGGDGDDALFGGSGNDLLNGGAGTSLGDYYNGGSGFDTVSYADAAFRILVSADRASDEGRAMGDTFVDIEAWLLTPFKDIFHAFATDDQVDGGADDDQIFGYGGNDLLIGGAGNDTLYGGDDDDNLQGGTGTDILFGGGGNNQLDGGLGADQMSGGAGDDIYFINDAGDTISESILIGLSGVDLAFSFIGYTLPNGVENLTIIGGAPLDGTGNSLANIIIGNGAANTLDGGGGADTLIGKGGNDTYVVDNAGDIVDESTGSLFDTDTVRSSITFNLANTAVVKGRVENLTLTGTAAINGTGNALDNVMSGNSANNILVGNDGNDRLDGGAGADTMFGGVGNDTYVVDNSADRVDETTGGAADIDTVLASVTFSLLSQVQTLGNVENVTLTGTANINAVGNGLDNTLIGNSGRNILTASAGNDDLTGGGGNDQLLGGSGNDTYRFSGSFGSDTIDDDSGTADKIVITGATTLLGTSRSGNDLIAEFSTGTITITDHFTTGTIEQLTFNGNTVVLAKGLVGADLPGIITGTKASETLDGKGGDDFLFGDKGDDILLGGLGNDRLEGGQGRDIVDGGAGDDILFGGAGRDTFVFRPSSLDGGAGHDVIMDFDEGDVIDLSAFHLGSSGFQPLGFLLFNLGALDLGWFSHCRGLGWWNSPLDISRDGRDTILSIGDSSIRLENVSHLEARDFIL